MGCSVRLQGSRMVAVCQTPSICGGGVHLIGVSDAVRPQAGRQHLRKVLLLLSQHPATATPTPDHSHDMRPRVHHLAMQTTGTQPDITATAPFGQMCAHTQCDPLCILNTISPVAFQSCVWSPSLSDTLIAKSIHLECSRP